MTSKERIRAAIQRQETDRVPSTMQCVETAWDKLRAHFNVATNEEVQDILDIDTRIMDLPPYIGPAHEPFVNEDGETVYTHPFGYKYIKKVERLSNSRVIYSRKLSPNFVGVDVNLDEDAFRAYMKKTIDLPRDCCTEIIFRDVYTVHNNPAKARRAVEIVKGLI